MNKKEFEMMLNNILTEIKDVPDNAEVMIDRFEFAPTIHKTAIHLDYDDEMFMSVDNKKDCANLKVIIINSRD